MAYSAADCSADKIAGSLQLLEHMRGDGLDLDKPRTVSHLFIGDHDKLEPLIAILAAQGFSIEPDEQGLLAVSKVAVNDEWVRRVMPAMCAAAASTSFEYDGWDIDVADDNVRSDTLK